jgi:NADH:ubiquinone oxidoreductase subunit 3 (subunit A)
MSRQNFSFAFLAIAVVLLVLAVATVIPFPEAAISDMGYYSLCPFAPWSTLMLLFGAGVCWALRQHIESRP